MMLQSDSISQARVAIAKGPAGVSYPELAPFLPDQNFPELKTVAPLATKFNAIYPLIRELLYEFGLDRNNFGTPDWNPLGSIISPGQRVLVKPNLVRHLHMAGGDFQAVVTHASVVRCVLDYVAKALKGAGEILVGDAPVQSANFSALIEKTGHAIVCENIESLWGIPVRLIDFRLVAVELNERHQIIRTEKKQGDPAGYINVDLGFRSMLHALGPSYKKFRVTSYDCKEMINHHNQDQHEYLIPRSVLAADVVINIPKLKTHRKVGLTASLKNLVGINGHKDWLPHHRNGSVKEGGDEYFRPCFIKNLQNFFGGTLLKQDGAVPRTILHFATRELERLSAIICRDQIKEGNWHGNDTAWRMVLDLNRLLIYADREGRMTNRPQRKVFSIVDAIVAGDGEGPMEPNARHCGILACGDNPLAVDTVLSTLVGFDYRKLPLLANAYNIQEWKIAKFKPAAITVVARDAIFKDFTVGKPFYEFCFIAPKGWKKKIEFLGCLGI